MKILFLGGTQFLGRHLAEIALTRGHTITLFNRGRTNPDLFPDAEQLLGDRGGNLAALENRRWDAVVDTSGYASHKVRASVKLLAGSVDHYTFISSISVYSDFSRLGLDESAPITRLSAGAIEDEGNGETYGPRKASCEDAVTQSLADQALIVRPGIIAGPHDPTGRFTYWARRTAQRGDVLAPAPPDAPVQLIDVRDLAGWIIQMAEQKKTGVYNTAGPDRPLTFEQMLEACRMGAQSDARFTWVDEQFLLDHSVVPFKDLPLWIPKSERAYAGHFAVDSRRAFASGLTCRPLSRTAQDTLASDRHRSRETSPGPAVLDSERERELLKRWKQRV